MYLSLYLRHPSTPVHDNHTRNGIKDTFLRVVVFCLISLIAALPALLIKLEYVHSPIVIMFTNIIVPAILVSYTLLGGPYDKIIEKFR